MLMKRSLRLQAAVNLVHQLREELELPGLSETMAETRARVLGACNAISIELEEEMEAARALFGLSFHAWSGDPAARSVPFVVTNRDRVLFVGALCFVLFECACGAVLASMTFAVPQLLAVAIGISLTVVMTFGMKAVWQLYVAAEECQPRKGLARLHRWLIPLFTAWTATLTLALLLPRLADESSVLLNILFNVTMSALSTLSPALGGLLFTAADIYGWSRTPTREYRDMLIARREFGHVREQCLRVPRPAPPSPDLPVSADRVAAGRNGDARHLVGSGALMLLLLALFATSAQAQMRGQLWLDDSPSPSAEDLAQAERQFFAALPAVSDASGSGSWRFFRFGRDANVSAVASLTLVAHVAPACETSEKSDELRKLFKRPRGAGLKHDADRCAEARTAARERYERERLSNIARAKAALDVAPRVRGSCTALADVLRRVANEPREQAPTLVVLVTDGEESCEPVHGVRLPAPASATRTLLILVPSNADARAGTTPWKEFERRRKQWREMAPWVETHPSAFLTSSALVSGSNDRPIAGKEMR
jgi:hypothetical protein